MTRLFMFDMDGVLFDSMPRHAQCWVECMRRDFGREVPAEEIYLHEGRTSRSIISLMARKYLGHELTPEQTDNLYVSKSSLLDALGQVPQIPGAFDLVGEIHRRGYDSLVVTGSGYPAYMNRIYAEYPGCFHREWMVSAQDSCACKPSPEPYLTGLRKASEGFVLDGGQPVSAAEAIVVENAPLGVEAGHAAGCLVVAVNTGPLPSSMLSAAGADFVFGSMPEFLEHLPEVLSRSDSRL